MSTPRCTSKVEAMNILIVGAGIGGSALASFLLLGQLNRGSATNVRITVLERSSSIRGHGQNIDIRGPGKELLARLGIDDQVRAATTGEEGARFVDSAGRAWASFAVDKTGEVETGTGEIEILRGRLAEILFNRCSELSERVKGLGGNGVEFIFGDYLDSIQQAGESANKLTSTDGSEVRVHLAKRKQWRRFNLVIGADGLQSRTRALVWGTEYGNTEGHPEEIAGPDQASRAAEATIRHRTAFKSDTQSSSVGLDHIRTQTIEDGSYNGSEAEIDSYLRPLDVYTAFFSVPSSIFSDCETTPSGAEMEYTDGWRRWYHAPGRKSVMLRPSDDSTRLTVLMNILDLDRKDPRLRSVATTRADRTETVQKQKQLMGEYFQEAGWECATLVDGMNAADDFYYDLVAQVKMEKWSNGRVCLLGDAAHCASPFSGMGTTLALVGAYNLAGALTKNVFLHKNGLPRSKSSSADKDELTAKTEDLAAAFSDYEHATRPLVTDCQKLPPGMPRLIHPETAWGLWVMRSIFSFLSWSGIFMLLARIAGRFKGKSREHRLLQWDP